VQLRVHTRQPSNLLLLVLLSCKVLCHHPLLQGLELHGLLL
jgi:hypothetical protein